MTTKQTIATIKILDTELTMIKTVLIYSIKATAIPKPKENLIVVSTKNAIE